MTHGSILKKQLPELNEPVLIYVEKWEGKQVAYLYRSGMKNVGLMWQTSNGDYDFTLSEVPKWMPLPD